MNSDNSVGTRFAFGVVLGMLLGAVFGGKSEEKTSQQKLEEKTERAIDKFMEQKQYWAAVAECYQFLFDFIRSKSGIQEEDGNVLIERVFSRKKPLLKFTRHAEYPTVKNSDEGYYYLLKGVVLAFRNPISHARIEMTETEASAQILLMAYLYRVIRDNTIRVSQDKK